MRNALRGILFFSVLGPLVAGLIFWMLFSPVKPSRFASVSDELYWHLDGLFLDLSIVYIVGIIPAAITGYIASKYRSKLSGPLSFVKFGLIAAAVTAIYVLIYFVLGMIIKESARWNAGILLGAFPLAIFGFISGLIVAILFVLTTNSNDQN